MSLSTYSTSNLVDGEFRCFDVAYTVTPSQGFLSQVAMLGSLADAADSLRAFYQSDTSGCLEYKISLPESEVAPLGAFSVYPNPAHAELNITVAAGVNVESIEVIALSGNKVLQSTSAAIINVEGLSSGIYFIQLQTNIGLLNERFIKD